MTATSTLLVSVVIPAFNCGSVLAETLESVRAQTFKDFEVIIVDDGSTDDTAAVAQRFCQMDSRFTLIQQSNGGVCAARNTAIERSRGEWIAFLDGDDVWLPEKLERQMDLSRQDPKANLLFTNLFFWDGQRDLRIAFEPEQILAEGDPAEKLVLGIHNVCPGCMSTILVRRKMFLAAGIFDPQFIMSEDWDLLLRTLECGLWVRGTREPLARYRRWNGNMTNQKLKVAENRVRVLEKNLQANRRTELCTLYEHSLMQGIVYLAQVMVQTDPAALPDLILRVWQRERRWKWLRWYLFLKWPFWLGGGALRRCIYRKIPRADSPEIFSTKG